MNNHLKTRAAIWGLALLVLVLLGPALNETTQAQPAAENGPQVTATTEGKEMTTFSGIVKAGGWIGFMIILMSVAAMALVVEHFITIRRKQLLPDELAEELQAQINAKHYPQAQERCAEDGSFLAVVIAAGLGQAGSMFGFFDMQSAMQEASERQVSKLYRKLEYLSFIAASAPMLGLLGTVIGMMSAFNKIAATEGAARPSQLAGGIAEALVTTFFGLSVAIPAMFFVSFFRNRIDSYVGEAEGIVEKLMGSFRKTGA